MRPLKSMNTYSHRIKFFFTTALLATSFFILALTDVAVTMSFEAKKREFINRISSIAENFIGIPYEFGGSFKESEGIDNSHLCFSEEETGHIFPLPKYRV